MDAFERTQLDYQKLLDESIPLGQAAIMLSTPSHELRRRIQERALYGIVKEGVWHLPRFQFVGDRLLPGLDHVLPAIGYGAHPLELQRWFTLPHQGLVVGDAETPVSPAEWLVTGQPVENVVRLADEVLNPSTS